MTVWRFGDTRPYGWDGARFGPLSPAAVARSARAAAARATRVAKKVRAGQSQRAKKLLAARRRKLRRYGLDAAGRGQ